MSAKRIQLNYLKTERRNKTMSPENLSFYHLGNQQCVPDT